MRLNFLTSPEARLAKTITPTSIEPYPHAYRFTSHPVDITDIQEFYAEITKYANLGGCLLKGALNRPLNNESRAGSTNSDSPTEFIVLDIDRCDPAIKDPDDVIKQCLPDAFHNVDYIWQWSNSAGIKKPGIAGHFFFMLERKINAKVLKQLLTHFNLISDSLNNQIKLSHNGVTLTYGLDITCAQNDKLIFIAPPTLVDITDPYPNRIILTTHDYRKVALDPTLYDISYVENACTAKTNELRAAAGLPRKTAKYKVNGTTNCLNNPERAIFRGPYKEGRGFRYGNLNQGDSYAYYHRLENPDILFNFKGEPPVLIKDIDPDYWRELYKEANPQNKNKLFIAFRDRQTDSNFTTIFNTDTNTHLTYQVKSQTTALDFLRLHRQNIPDVLPIWDVIFDPEEDFVIDLKGQRLNLYQKTEFLRNAEPSKECPPKFFELVTHVVGGCEEMRDEFFNWLAFIVQKKTKAQTAFVLHGHTGTGKGVLFTRVIRPILGILQTPMMTMEDIDLSWNDWLETAILAVIDEAQINDDAKKVNKRTNKIKNLITEEPTLLKKKYANTTQIKNRVSFIFTANEHDSVHIVNNDRRFKVCPRQEQPINYTEKDLDILDAELQQITNFLIGYTINITKVRAVPHNKARDNLIKASQTGIDEFIDIIKNGDLGSLAQHLNEPVNSKNALFLNQFENLVNQWSSSKVKTMWVAVSDLRAIYSFLFGIEVSPNRFGRILANKNVPSEVRWVDQKPTRSVLVTWKKVKPTTG